MSLHTIFYEFPLTEANIEVIVEDLGIAQQNAISTSEAKKRILNLINDFGSASPKVDINGKPGLVFNISKNLSAERLPHAIEGVKAYIHSSSEGQLDLEDFSRFFEASLKKNNIKYTKY